MWSFLLIGDDSGHTTRGKDTIVSDDGRTCGDHRESGLNRIHLMIPAVYFFDSSAGCCQSVLQCSVKCVWSDSRTWCSVMKNKSLHFLNSHCANVFLDMDHFPIAPRLHCRPAIVGFAAGRASHLAGRPHRRLHPPPCCHVPALTSGLGYTTTSSITAHLTFKHLIPHRHVPHA